MKRSIFPQFLFLTIVLFGIIPSFGQTITNPGANNNATARKVVVVLADPSGGACVAGDVRDYNGILYTCQSSVYVNSGTASVPDATSTVAGKSILGAQAPVAFASLGACAAGNRGQSKQLTDLNKGTRTCTLTTGSTYAWVDDDPVVEVANYGIVSDGVIDQTPALTTLFGGTLSSYTGVIHIPYNTLFTAMTVYAAVPANARLDDDSVINWGQFPTYTNKFKTFAFNDTAANDSALNVVSTHHPAIILNNTRTSGTASALLARSTILFGAGRTQTGDPLTMGYFQMAKKQSTDVWGMQLIRQSKWLGVSGSVWAASTVYAASDYVRSGAYYYSTAAGGTSGATAPTHTSGSASDGGVAWVYQGVIDNARFAFEVDEDGRMGVGVQADNTSNLTVSEGGTAANTVITYTNPNNSSSILETRTALDSGGSATSIRQTTDGNGLTIISNATTGTPILEYSTTQFYSYVPQVAATTLFNGLAANGGSALFTLRGYSPNAANGSYGRMLLFANSSMTGNARQFLVTNALNNTALAFIRSADATTTPTLNTSGVVTSGTTDFSIDYTGAVSMPGTVTVGTTTDGGSSLLTMQGYATDGANGIYGRMLFNANANFTGSARKWLLTNANTSFRIIRSVDAATTPTLGSTGTITSGTADLTIDSAGAITTSGKLTVGATLTVANVSVTATSGGTTTLDLSLGNHRSIQMPAGNTTLALSNVCECDIDISVLQDSVGGRTITFPSTMKEGTITLAKQPSPTALYRTDYSFRCDTTNCYLKSINYDGVSGQYMDLVNDQSVAGTKTFTTALRIASSSANALVVGLNGVTNPALQVDASTVSSATGVSVTSAAAGAGVGFAAISSGSNEQLNIAGKGTGSVKISPSLIFNQLAFSNTAPTVTSAGTSPSIPFANGTAAFTVNVGSGGTATTVVLAMPAATNGWNCQATNRTAAAANRADFILRQTATTTTSVTIQSQSGTLGTALAFAANDIIACTCTAY